MKPNPLFLFPCLSAVAAVAAEPLQFNRDIRPILSEHCFACHGFDEKERKAKLRLDLPEGALATNEDGEAAIVAGNLDASLAWERIVSTDPDEVMPPPKSHKELDDGKKAILKRWIEEGA
ncbi:MAG: hypothetical protein P8J87_13130, partial [Verrucomicrobiales bacterium]|nr:hypothetical protein [Verrucomicrobiales bacterium]